MASGHATAEAPPPASATHSPHAGGVGAGVGAGVVSHVHPTHENPIASLSRWSQSHSGFDAYSSSQFLPSYTGGHASVGAAVATSVGAAVAAGHAHPTQL